MSTRKQIRSPPENAQARQQLSRLMAKYGRLEGLQIRIDDSDEQTTTVKISYGYRRVTLSADSDNVPLLLKMSSVAVASLVNGDGSDFGLTELRAYDLGGEPLPIQPAAGFRAAIFDLNDNGLDPEVGLRGGSFHLYYSGSDEYGGYMEGQLLELVVLENTGVAFDIEGAHLFIDGRKATPVQLSIENETHDGVRTSKVCFVLSNRFLEDNVEPKDGAVIAEIYLDLARVMGDKLRG